MKDNTILAMNISVIRKKMGYKSLKDFEKLIGAPSQQLGKYEDGISKPKLQVLLMLEKISGISVYDLCNRYIDISQVPTAPLKEYRKDIYVNVSLIQQKLIEEMEVNRLLKRQIEKLKKKGKDTN